MKEVMFKTAFVTIKSTPKAMHRKLRLDTTALYIHARMYATENIIAVTHHSRCNTGDLTDWGHTYCAIEIFACENQSYSPKTTEQRFEKRTKKAWEINLPGERRGKSRTVTNVSLDGDAFRQVTGLVDIAAATVGNFIGQQLCWYGV